MHPQNNAARRLARHALNERAAHHATRPPDDSDHHARRLALMHTIGRTIDHRTRAIDPITKTPAERVRDLAVALGDLARANCDRDRIECLVEVAVLAQGQLEALDRDAAA
jgi:hypothetical protein